MFVNGHLQIFVRALNSDSPAQLTHASKDAEWPFWWPDGNRVGFISRAGVWSVSRAGREPEIVQKESVSAATLSPDGRTLATWRRTDAGTVEVIAIDVSTGDIRVVSSAPAADFNFATPANDGQWYTLGPDGTSFLGTIVRRRSELWILEDFAPRRSFLDWFRSRPSR
jgi:Tol biopolymer transport system component